MEHVNNKRISNLGVICAVIFLSGCGSLEIQKNHSKKITLENSMERSDLPTWTRDGKIGWDDGSEHYLKSQYTLRGDQRINACYDFAKLELKENLITEISTDLRGEINAAVEGIGENSDLVLNKSYSQAFDANIRGLQVREQVFERYIIGDTERIECFVLARISKAEYQNLKNNLFQKLTKSSEVAQALKARQVKFFTDEVPEE